jgi:hypothetical protein
MIRIALFTIAVFVFPPLQEKANTGFYIMISEKENCPQKFATMDKKQTYCVPRKPILDQSIFVSVTDVKILEKRKYIDLYLSTKGMDALKNLVKNLPNATIILVVDDKVIGVLRNTDIVGRFIRIDSDILSKDLEWIHDYIASGL